LVHYVYLYLIYKLTTAQIAGNSPNHIIGIFVANIPTLDKRDSKAATHTKNIGIESSKDIATVAGPIRATVNKTTTTSLAIDSITLDHLNSHGYKKLEQVMA
jgi:hypothetical protein